LTGYCCVDLFAGTGVLGFESASRGAQKVWLFESHAALIQVHEQLKSKLQAHAVQIKRGDSLALLKGLEAGAVDIFFIDPPFDQDNLFDGALKQVNQYLSSGGRVYLESPKAWDDHMLRPYGLRVLKHLKAGAVHAHLLERGESSSG
jgi:16S rRNA G966 N2-methylase RsmD